MKRSFRQIVRDVIDKSDIVIEVVDARLIDQTRNQDLEKLIQEQGKRLIIVINKSDLAEYEFLEEKKKEFTNCVFLSSTKRQGVSHLREMIYKVAAKNKNDMIHVGVVGYPNTGKSSVINALKGKASAKAAQRSGQTRGKQNVKVTNRIMVIDTPGVIPLSETDTIKLAVLASKNADQVKDPDLVAVEIIATVLAQGNMDVLNEQYNVQIIDEEPYEILEMIALSRKRIKKGGEPDILTMSRLIIQDWQKGSLK